MPEISKLYLGLGWKVNEVGEAPFDLDASKVHPSGSVEHMGDALTGSTGSQDDEQIKIDLSRVPSTINKIVFAVTIDKTKERGQNFGQVPVAFVRVVDEANDVERLRYDLREKFSAQTAVIVAELSRRSGSWIFTAIGEGIEGGLEAVCKKFGVNV